MAQVPIRQLPDTCPLYFLYKFYVSQLKRFTIIVIIISIIIIIVTIIIIISSSSSSSSSCSSNRVLRWNAYNTNNPNNKKRWADVVHVYRNLDFNFYCDFRDICSLIHQLMLYA